MIFVGFGAEIDEFELENELAQLEQEALSKEMAQIELPTVPAQTGIGLKPAATKDPLAELAQWAS